MFESPLAHQIKTRGYLERITPFFYPKTAGVYSGVDFGVRHSETVRPPKSPPRSLPERAFFLGGGRDLFCVDGGKVYIGPVMGLVCWTITRPYVKANLEKTAGQEQGQE